MSHQFEIHTRNNLDYVYDIEGFPQHWKISLIFIESAKSFSLLQGRVL